VPPFFAHEGDMLRRLQSNAVPSLLGHDADRVLLADVEGDDQYDAAEPELLDMVSMLVDLQVAWAGRVDDLLAIGLPDWRGPALTARIADVAGRRSAALSDEDRATLAAFVDDLPARFAAIDACGIQDTLVHGDYHPGNVRGAPGRLVMLDWGDTGVGQPLLDLPAFLEAVPRSSVDRIRAHWLGRWQAAVPGCDPWRAAGLLAPVAAARQAVIYQTFVDHIEPVERRHHDADAIEWLGRAATLARAGEGAR
jgi:aminoglycoside phosphotransferase (APT) family kinase protein